MKVLMNPGDRKCMIGLAAIGAFVLPIMAFIVLGLLFVDSILAYLLARRIKIDKDPSNDGPGDSD